MERYVLPDGWAWTTIGEVCQVNPTMSWPDGFTEDTPISFVPMAAVDEESGAITKGDQRPIGEVWKGYKRFQEGDVIFARITPCMENGKAALAMGLEHGIGVGSTEFHVLRSTDAISAEYLYHFARQQSFREEAAASMTGTAGQLRVPASFMTDASIPLPPLAEQRRIVAKLDSLLAQARHSRAALDRIPPLLKQARQAILAAAFRGDLTERDPGDEPAHALLARIRAERRARWEADLRARGKDPARQAYTDPAAPDTADLPELPEGWAWTNMGNVFTIGIGGTPSRKRPDFWNGTIPWVSSGEVAFRRISATLENITEAGLHGSSAKVHPPGTVLLAMIGEGKTRGQAAILDIPAATNQNVASLLVSDTPILPDWVYWWLMASYADTRGDGSGGAQPALNSARVKLLPLPVAPLSEQRVVSEQIRLVFSQADAIQAAARLARRRLDLAEQAVLARAFRGELVPQDPTDEPAAAMLARLREAREAESRGQETENGKLGAKGKRRGRQKKQPSPANVAAVQGRLSLG